MAIKVGDRVPEAKFRVMTSDGPAWRTTDEIFKGKKVALFAVPGAFTGTCHKMHVPSITQNADAIKAKGVDTIAVTSVNDVFVMDAWKKATAADKVDFLADGNGEFAKAGRGRRGEEAQCRGSARPGPGLRRRRPAQAALIPQDPAAQRADQARLNQLPRG